MRSFISIAFVSGIGTFGYNEKMDPLTALGLSASIVQFVNFAVGLISETKEIHASAQGCSESSATIETVYAQLRELSVGLELSSQGDPKLELLERPPEFVKHVFAINDLARLCKEDCTRLVAIVETLKMGSSVKSSWRSFRLALRTAWKANEISDLEQRLHYSQTTLTLHVCAITRYAALRRE